tara:strand:- start:236 stop:3421 length:3186 start_codon:yes stop_codon:yes gene_type:complete
MIKKVLHLADIHARLSQRHEEYRHVFKNFYKQAREQNPDIIVIAGDIFHQKIHLSPEVIKLIGEFFNKCAKIAPIHVIIGNHDTIIAQKGRIDSVSAVLGLARIDNVYLYTKSDLYEVDNIVFGVFDVNDEKNFPINPVREEGKTYVALFHGPINNSINEAKFRLESRYKLDMFDGYDIAMLGDIHTRQTMQKRSVLNGVVVPQVEYSGSFIQQKFSEENEKGYLIWDIEKYESTFHVIKSKYGYRTVSLSKTSIENIDMIKFDFPEKPYLRVLLDHDCYDITRSKYVESTLMRKYKPLYLTIEIDYNKKTRTSNISDVQVENVVELDVQQKLLSEYLSSFPNIDKGDIKKALLLHEETYNSSTTNEFDLYKGLNWNIKRMSFSNVFSYGENNVINFDKLKGLTGIFSANASGKSSLLYTILTAFFNMSARAHRRQIVDVINKNKDKATIKVEFSIDANDYVIRREIKRTKKDPSRAKNTVEFYQIVGGEEQNIMGKANTLATEKHIRGMLGSFEEHSMTTFSQQFDATSFIDYAQTNRKELLSKFLGLDIIDNLHQSIKEESTLLKRSLSEYNKHDYNSLIKVFEDREVMIQKEISELNIERGKKYDKLKEKNAEVNDLHVKIKTVAGQEYNKDDIEKEINLVINQRKSSEEENNNRLELNKKLSAKKISIVEGIKSFEEENILSARVDIWGDKRNEKSVVVGKMNVLQKEKDRHQNDLKILDTHEWFSSADVCKKCTFLTNAFDSKDKIPVLESKIGFLNDKKTEHTQWMEKYRDDKPKLEELRSLRSEIENIDWEVKRNEASIRSYGDFLHNNEEKEKLLVGTLDTYHKNKFSIEYNKKIKKDIVILQQEIKVDEECITKDIEKKITSRNVEFGQVNQKLMELYDLTEKVSCIEEKNRIHNLLKNALSNNGIPLTIISKVVPIINDEIRKILSNMSNFDVMLEVDTIDQDLHIFIDDGTSKRKVELGSGMEKTIAAIVIRAALASISLLPMCNLFIIDESFGALDSDNLSEIQEILQTLKTRFSNVMIISHIDVMKDMVDNNIGINKDVDGYSYLNID